MSRVMTQHITNLKHHPITKLMCLAVLALFVALQPTNAKAESYRGSFSASSAEISKHRNEMRNFSSIVQSCLDYDYQHHVSFYRKYGFSPFYGSNSSFKRLSYSGKRNYLSRIGKNPNLVDQMQITSCVGLATKCYERAFNQTGQGATWSRLKRYIAANNYDGSSMIDGLRQLGWYVMYWNPDTAQNAEWDRDEKRKNPSNNGTWGYHAWRYMTSTKHKKYYKNPIDDAETLVNFGTHPPRFLRNASLMLGVAHAGYHVFPGYEGVVIEAHSTRDIRDPNTVESAEFNPIQNGGAPRGQYRSGILAVPPGSEPNRSFSPWGW